MAAYKLTYFPIKGLGEPIRLLMKYGSVQYDDYRFAFEEWPKIKPTTPFGSAPILTHKGKEYTQSVAICRYIAKQVKLTGRDDLEDLEIDSIVDTICDMRMKILNDTLTNEEIEPSKKEVLLNETVPFYLQRFDKIVKENNGYFALKKLTWADIFFVALIDNFRWHTKTEFVDKYENLSALRDKVLAIPNIKKWVEERPNTAF